NPTSPAGRVMFATGAAVLTVLIRLKANLPEGCLYSILLMNMFTPMIEQALDGKQLQMVNKARIIAGVLLVLGLASCFYVSATVEPVASLKSSATSAATTAATGEGESGDEEHASTEATAGGEGEGDAEHASTEATEGTEDAE
ncbi:RnfABCDGE type electron transport complex subunit D, partial [Faecalibaculum rodentium]